MGVVELLIAVMWLLIGVVALLFAVRARRRGSPPGAWLVPGVGGTLFILWGLFLLWLWAAA